MYGYYAIFAVFLLISWLVSNRLKRKFKEYSKIPTSYGITGREVAEKMLRDNGINDVSVTAVQGELTDHYNPVKKTINLSENVYHGNSVAAAAVAAHECGHAVQHAKSYEWLNLRSKLVPAVSFASRWMQWVLLAGILMISSNPVILLVGIILFGLTTVFSFVTLPVEMDASKRALVWLNSAGITSSQSHEKAKDALNWAGYTYVVAALGSLSTLLYYIFLFMGVDD